jgi:hypothetical protein
MLDNLLNSLSNRKYLPELPPFRNGFVRGPLSFSFAIHGGNSPEGCPEGSQEGPGLFHPSTYKIPFTYSLDHTSIIGRLHSSPRVLAKTWLMMGARPPRRALVSVPFSASEPPASLSLGVSGASSSYLRYGPAVHTSHFKANLTLAG